MAILHFQIKLARKNQDTLEKRKRERDEQIFLFWQLSILHFQIKLARKNQDTLEKGKRERDKQIFLFWQLSILHFQIKLARKNQDTLEKRKRERDELAKQNTVLEEEEELNLELRPLPDDEVL